MIKPLTCLRTDYKDDDKEQLLTQGQGTMLLDVMNVIKPFLKTLCKLGRSERKKKRHASEISARFVLNLMS